MKLASRIKNILPSVTQRKNEEINKLIDEGEFVYNLTSGQLPFHPPKQLIHSLESELKFLNSFQYSPVAGNRELRDKVIENFKFERRLESYSGSVIISNGAKQSIYNALGSLVEEGDEVLLIAPYWVSFSEMIKFWRGKPVIFHSHSYDNYEPDLNELEKSISKKTKVLILNSPNNPTGVSYSAQWMKSFAVLLKKFPELIIISDEIYCKLSYFDPKPTYFYEYDNSLLERTVIINGISKSFAATGLRIGFTIAPIEIVNAMRLIQSQTTSGANSLSQRALANLDFQSNNKFLENVLSTIRNNASFLREKLRQSNLSHCWYQSTGAFYFLFNFSSTPYFESHFANEKKDMSKVICDQLFQEKKVALVPGEPFGAPNSGRLSLAFDELLFEEAITHIVEFCHQT